MRIASRITIPMAVMTLVIQTKNMISPLDTLHLNRRSGTHDREVEYQTSVLVQEILRFGDGQDEVIVVFDSLGDHQIVSGLENVKRAIPQSGISISRVHLDEDAIVFDFRDELCAGPALDRLPVSGQIDGHGHLHCGDVGVVGLVVDGGEEKYAGDSCNDGQSENRDRASHDVLFLLELVTEHVCGVMWIEMTYNGRIAHKEPDHDADDDTQHHQSDAENLDQVIHRVSQ